MKRFSQHSALVVLVDRMVQPAAKIFDLALDLGEA